MLFLFSAVLMLSLGLILGTLIAVFARVFEVKEDPRIGRVAEILPSYNCGACGYPGCRPYAEAIVLQKAPHDKCGPGGKEAVERIGLLLDSGVRTSREGQPAVL